MAQRKQRKGKVPPKRPLFPKEVKPDNFPEFAMIQIRRMGLFVAVGIIMTAFFMWSSGPLLVLEFVIAYFIVPWALMLYLWWRFNMVVGLLAAVAVFAGNELLLRIFTA